MADPMKALSKASGIQADDSHAVPAGGSPYRTFAPLSRTARETRGLVGRSDAPYQQRRALRTAADQAGDDGGVIARDIALTPDATRDVEGTFGYTTQDGGLMRRRGIAREPVTRPVTRSTRGRR